MKIILRHDHLTQWASAIILFGMTRDVPLINIFNYLAVNTPKPKVSVYGLPVHTMNLSCTPSYHL